MAGQAACGRGLLPAPRRPTRVCGHRSDSVAGLSFGSCTGAGALGLEAQPCPRPRRSPCILRPVRPPRWGHGGKRPGTGPEGHQECLALQWPQWGQQGGPGGRSGGPREQGEGGPHALVGHTPHLLGPPGRGGGRGGGKERVSTTASQVCEKQLGGFLTAVETESWPRGPCSAGAARWGDRSPQGTATASPRASLRKPTGSHRSHGRAPSPRRSTMRTS